MWARLDIVLGLLAGIAAAVLILGGVLVLAPEALPTATPAPLPTFAATPAPPSQPPATVPPSEAAPSPSEFIGGDEARRGNPWLASVPGVRLLTAAGPGSGGQPAGTGP